DVSAIKLYDGTTQIGSSQALNTNTHKATFNVSWVIPAGVTKYLTVKVSIASKGTATVGDSIVLGIDDAADITSTATLTGTFPINGKALTIAGISVGELFVAVNASPAAATILSGSTEQEIASWTFTASSSEAVSVTKIAITHVGSAAGTDLSNIKLKYAGAQLGATVAQLDSQNQAVFDLSSTPLEILAGGAKVVYAYADIASGIWTTRTAIFEITQYTDVTVYGGNSGGAIEATASDTAAFSKQTGQTMSIGQGTVTVNIDAAYNPASQNYVKGTTNKLMSAFKFSAGSTEGIRVTKLKLKLNDGNGSATDVSNITLWDGSTQIAGPVSLIGYYATFGSNTIGYDTTGLFDVAKSSNKTIQVKADIPNGATTAHTIDLDIAAYSDMWIDGLDSRYDLTLSASNLTSGNANTHTITANGALTVALASQSPASQTYIKGSTGMEMLRFNLTADSGEDISVSSLTIDLSDEVADSADSGDFTNVKLLKMDGTQLGSTVASPSNEAAFSFNLTVPASETVTLKVVTDIPSTTGLTSTGYFVLDDAADITSTGVSSSADLTETGSATGNTMTIGEGSLTVSAAATPGDQNAIIGSVDVPIVGLVFTAGSAEDVRVTRIKLSACSKEVHGQNTDAQDVYGGDQDDLTNIALYDGSTRLTAKKTWDSSTATTVTFTASDFLNSQGITITKGQQKNITVKGDVPSTGTADHAIALGISSTSDAAGSYSTHVTFVGLSSNTTPTTTISYSSAIGGVNFTSSSAADTQINYVTLKGAGTLTVASSPDTPESAIVTVGAAGVGRSDVVFLKVDFTANREDIDIKALTIDRINRGDVDFASISLWDGTTQLGVSQSLVNYGIDNSSSTFSFPSGSYWRIPSGVTKTLTVKANLSGTKTTETSGTITGDSPKLCLASSTDAMGASSGTTISANTAAICGNYQVLHKSKPTVAAASLPTTVYGAGEKTLYRWTVTADSKGAIGWMKVIFDISGSVHLDSSSVGTIGYGGGNAIVAGTLQSTGTDGVYMGTSSTPDAGIAYKLISTSTLKVYNVATGDQITASSTVEGMGAYGVAVWNFTQGGARIVFIPSTEQVIAAGETKTYELRGNLLYGGLAGDAISVQIAKRSTATNTSAFSTLARDVDGNAATAWTATSTASTFVWTDRSGAASTAVTHSSVSSDWSNDYKVSGLPTASLSLSK
ncbi:MAG: hypothetical protein PHQ43_10130, partial [Dehalococcoidales bacterium]|nr:hypothetical protein [Dehalococcoidales bacterium]